MTAASRSNQFKINLFSIPAIFSILNQTVEFTILVIYTNIKKQIRQDPKLDGSKPIYRSNNEDKGIEFTWSSWLKLDQVPTVATENRLYHIYNKGSEPGVWVDGD